MPSITVVKWSSVISVNPLLELVFDSVKTFSLLVGAQASKN